MSMFITPLESLGIIGSSNTVQGLSPFQQRTQRIQSGDQTGGLLGELEDSSFGSIFKSLIQNVKDTDAEFTQAQYLLATGQLDNPAELGIAGYKAEIAVELLIQLRNKALDAYSELTRLSI